MKVIANACSAANPLDRNLVVGMDPRILAGEISAIYMGETTDAPPTPSPPINRKNKKLYQSHARPDPSAEIRYKIASRINTERRPNLSAGLLINIAPMMVPIRALATENPSWKDVNSNVVLNHSVVPEITAVSNPKRSPPRAHDQTIRHWGWDFKMYFRELVAHVDSSFRTIADRDHRGITGLSMGGLTSLYISGQNKDLVSSTSAFCPADNIPQYGPKGHLSVFPVLEMYRSLKGLSMRLTATDGDWLLWNDKQMKRIFEGSGFEPFEYHLADFPEHWAADTDLQLDFHMAEFDRIHPRPDTWNHICPSYKTFDQWGYNITIGREDPAITILEDMSAKHMKIFARRHIPDGPIIVNENVGVSTDTIYEASAGYV